LRFALRQRKSSVYELWLFAEFCLVQTIIKPYIEAML